MKRELKGIIPWIYWSLDFSNTIFLISFLSLKDSKPMIIGITIVSKDKTQVPKSSNPWLKYSQVLDLIRITQKVC